MIGRFDAQPNPESMLCLPASGAQAATTGRPAMAARATTALFVLGLVTAAASPLAAAEPGAWSARAPLSGPRENHGVIALDGRILVVGGNAGTDSQIVKTEEYDPATDR